LGIGNPTHHQQRLLAKIPCHKPIYALGLDYGTNSVRCLIIDTQNGQELASAVAVYEHGQQGIVTDPKNPDLARQHPDDYLNGAIASVKKAIELATIAAQNFIPIGLQA
jgi:L-ribulokinase